MLFYRYYYDSDLDEVKRSRLSSISLRRWARQEYLSESVKQNLDEFIKDSGLEPGDEFQANGSQIVCIET